jgi:hypothetical protein
MNPGNGLVSARDYKLCRTTGGGYAALRYSMAELLRLLGVEPDRFDIVAVRVQYEGRKVTR